LEDEVLVGVGMMGSWFAINFISGILGDYAIFFLLIIPIGRTWREKIIGVRQAEVIHAISPFCKLVWRIFWWGIVIGIATLLFNRGFLHSR